MDYTRTTSVSRTRLLDTLRANLVKHRSDYAEAMVGYAQKRRELTKTLADAAALALANDDSESRSSLRESWDKLSSLDRPVDHSADYEQAIALAEWETRDTIDLTVNEFEKYVRDNWSWAPSFKTLVSSYSVPRK